MIELAAGSADRMTMSRSGRDTLILGIETSCDETAAALVMGGSDVLSSVVSSQIELHADVRRRRSRRSPAGPTSICSIRSSPAAIVEAGVDDRASTPSPARSDPALIGALLVGVSAAKSLALAWDVPFVAVNHLEAHLYAALLDDPSIELPDRRAARVGRPHDARRDDRARRVPRCSGRRSTTPPARRSTRSPGSSASAIRVVRPSSGRRRSGDPPRSPSHERCSTTGSTSASAGSRRRCSTTCARTLTSETADVAASFQAAVVDVLVHKARKAAALRRGQRTGARRWGRRQLASCASSCSTPAPRTGCAVSCRAAPCAPTTRR